MLESVKPLYLLGKTKKPVTITITGFTGDERIELPPKVLETPIIPFDQSPTLDIPSKPHTLYIYHSISVNTTN